MIIYTAEVYTGNDEQFSEEVLVYLQMFGSNGDSGRRLLYRSINNDIAFSSGQMDMFEVEAVHLGAIKKIVVSVDCNDEGLFTI